MEELIETAEQLELLISVEGNISDELNDLWRALSNFLTTQGR